MPARRSPLAGASKLALKAGIVEVNPVAQAPQPKARRSAPKHWSPEEARRFLALMEGDRTWTVWAFLMRSGLRVGEVVALRWPNVDLEGGVVRVVGFSTYVGHDVVPARRTFSANGANSVWTPAYGSAPAG